MQSPGRRPHESESARVRVGFWRLVQSPLDALVLHLSSSHLIKRAKGDPFACNNLQLSGASLGSDTHCGHSRVPVAPSSSLAW